MELAAEITTDTGLDCPICGTARERFVDLSDRPQVKCPRCGSVERHRAFAQAYKARFDGHAGFAGQRILAIRPDQADKVMLSAFGAKEVVTYDAFPRDAPDVVGDPTALHFPDDRFDAVFSNGFLATVRDPASVLSELRRVLKPDGVALFYESTSFGKSTQEVTDPERQASWWGRDVVERYGVGLFREWGFADLEDQLSETFGLGLFETSDPASGKVYVWFFAAAQPMVGGPFLDAEQRAELLGAHGAPGLRGAPPYACTLCDQTFDEIVGKDGCPHCKAHSRTRSLPEFVREHLTPIVDRDLAARLPLLGFAVVDAEQAQLAHLFPTIRKVSLYGSYTHDNEQGVDARDLSRFADGTFSGVFAIGLYDYFQEHEQALAEAFRVTAPGGVFALLILPARLRSGDQPPRVESMIERRGDYYEYLPEGVRMASVTVGRRWFTNAMARAGWEPRTATVFDPATGITNTWFFGRKPA